MPIYPVSWAVTYIPLWFHLSRQNLHCLAPLTMKQRKKLIPRMMLRLVHRHPFTLAILLLPLVRRLHLSRSQRPAGETSLMPSGPIPYTPCTKRAMPMMVSKRRRNRIQLYLFRFLLSTYGLRTVLSPRHLSLTLSYCCHLVPLYFSVHAGLPVFM